MKILLKDLVHQSVEFTRNHQCWGLREDEVLQLIDFVGDENAHLVNPLNRDPLVPYFRPRQTPLTGEEKVYNKYIAMNYCGHDQSLRLETFGSLEEMEENLLSPGGLINSWTTYVFAFVDGQLHDYELLLELGDGSTSICDNHKDQKDGGNSHLFNNVKAKVRWR
jgi:hypothetical protein